jgi:DNA-binding MarR family transcriptional regulator
MSNINQELSEELMDCVPLIMRTIRAEMRSHRESDLSVPQFRALLFIHRNKAASLSQVADHLGLTPPTTSTLVDDLVQRGLVLRGEVKGNRRQLQLNLTKAGSAMLDTAHRQTASHLAQSLASLSKDDAIGALSSLRLLHSIFK